MRRTFAVKDGYETGCINVLMCRDADHIDSLVANPHRANGMEATRARSTRNTAPADDALTRLLHRLEPAPIPLLPGDVRPRFSLALGDRADVGHADSIACRLSRSNG